MSASPPPPPRRAPRPVFRPRFTLTLLYLVGFYFLFALLFILPDLFAVWRDMEPGPEQQARAEEVARAAMQGGRVYLALFAAVVVVGLGVYSRALPGFR